LKVLRILIFVLFALSVAVTSLVYAGHLHFLHFAHVVAAIILFLMIAVYLHCSAAIAALDKWRTLSERFRQWGEIGGIVTVCAKSIIRCDGVVVEGVSNVDESILSGKKELIEKKVGDTVRRGTINHGGDLKVKTIEPLKMITDIVPSKFPSYNVCAGVMAKSGIYVRNRKVLYKIAKSGLIYVIGNYPEREGYAVTKDTLKRIGVELSDRRDGELEIVLCNYEEFDSSVDAAITHNKITHLLKLVYISRLYRQHLWRVAIYAIVFFPMAVAAFVNSQFMIAVMAVAAFEAIYLLEIRRLDRAGDKLTFDKILQKTGQ